MWSVLDWFRKATFDVLILDVTPTNERQGEMQGVEQWLLLKSHWSNNLRSSSAVGPPLLFCTTETQISYLLYLKYILISNFD